jgi:TIR domain
MAKAFFSYAHEDKETVESIHAALVADYPDHAVWIDKYEIVAGESLLEKIAGGIDEAEKFFVFLSKVSVTKPWVKRELRSAIMDEIDGIRPDFIAPVLLESIGRVPRFLEDKLYIDLPGMTQKEWMAAFDAAITRTPAQPDGLGDDNLLVGVERGREGKHVALVHFQPRAWAEEFSFAVETNEDMVEPVDTGVGGIMEMLDFGDAASVALDFRNPRPCRTKRLSALAVREDLKAGERVTFRVEFPADVDAVRAIKAAGRW